MAYEFEFMENNQPVPIQTVNQNVRDASKGEWGLTSIAFLALVPICIAAGVDRLEGDAEGEIVASSDEMRRLVRELIDGGSYGIRDAVHAAMKNRTFRCWYTR